MLAQRLVGLVVCLFQVTQELDAWRGPSSSSILIVARHRPLLRVRHSPVHSLPRRSVVVQTSKFNADPSALHSSLSLSSLISHLTPIYPHPYLMVSSTSSRYRSCLLPLSRLPLWPSHAHRKTLQFASQGTRVHHNAASLRLPIPLPLPITHAQVRTRVRMHPHPRPHPRPRPSR